MWIYLLLMSTTVNNDVCTAQRLFQSLELSINRVSLEILKCSHFYAGNRL